MPALNHQTLNNQTRSRNWKLNAVGTKATSLGYKVEFVRKVFGPRHIQDRIYISGRRCQVVSGLCPASTVEERTISSFRVPANSWAEFLIYVQESGGGRSREFFVVPRNRLEGSTFRSSGELMEYAEGWYLLKRNSERKATQYPGEAEVRAAESNARDAEMAGTNFQEHVI